MTDLVTLEEVSTELRWNSATLEKYGAHLGIYISAATPIIEDLAGPIVARSVTELSDGGRRSVALAHRPNAISSVTVDDVVWTGWSADLGAGLVYAGGCFPSGIQNVEVEYTVGTATVAAEATVAENVPANVKLATIALVVHNWRRSNQQQENPEEVAAVPSGFAVPNAVIQLLAPQKRLPGFA